MANKVSSSVFSDLKAAGFGDAPISIDMLTGAVNAPDDFDPDTLKRIEDIVAAHQPDAAPIDLGVGIRDWQFFTQLAIDKIISDQEALDTSSGQMPKLLTDALATIPDPGARLTATMKVRNTTTFYRNDPMVAFVAAYITQLGQFGAWDGARLDKLWDDAGKLT